jgi:hypothetical protein
VESIRRQRGRLRRVARPFAVEISEPQRCAAR